MKQIAAFQFANCYARREPGYKFAGGIYESPCYGWMNPVDGYANRNVRRTLLEGYVYADRAAEFHMGLPAGEYRVAITTYDKTQSRGPFCVKANGEFVLRNVYAPAGKIVCRSFSCRSRNDRLELEFLPHTGKAFLLNSMEVYATGPVKWRPLFKTVPSAEIPSRSVLLKHAENNPRKSLRRMCDWLVARCPASGYIGDIWTDGGYYSYTLAMPIRALLAGYDILGDRKYLKTAMKALDAFAAEQLPNGGFECIFRGRPVAERSKEEVAQTMKNGRIPMSDIGSPVSALAVASQYAPPAEKRRYTKAVQRFCDDWASRFQLKSGGFTDGQWYGYEGRIYSCATAIEAATHALAYKITGKVAYRRAAQRAIAYLLKDWRKDGRMLGRAPHWYVRNGNPFVMEMLHFGDLWYYDEGFITTWHHVPDGSFRDRVGKALENRVYGSASLLKALDGRVWWPLQDIWNNAKSIGIVQTLLFARQYGISSLRLESALAGMNRFLCTPDLAARLGIMVNDSEFPAALHGLLTWAGMANEATGFAGMTLGEAIKPGVLYLAAR